jgi:hypothetical protein
VQLHAYNAQTHAPPRTESALQAQLVGTVRKQRGAWLALHYAGIALFVAGNVAQLITLFFQAMQVLAFCLLWQDTVFVILLALLILASLKSLLAAGFRGKVWLETFPQVSNLDCHEERVLY